MNQELKVFEDYPVQAIEIQAQRFLRENKGIAISISLTKTGFHKSDQQMYALALLWKPVLSKT